MTTMYSPSEASLASASRLSARARPRPSLSATRAFVGAFAAALWIALVPGPAAAQGHAELVASARAALSKLSAQYPASAALEKRAVAVLVFPDVTKAGFLIGGEYGNGVMFRGGKFDGEYRTAGLSYGLQAGAQTFGYAMFFMNERARQALDATAGFQIGTGPSVVVLDEGRAKSLTTETLTNEAYAFIFGQQGLMAGVGLEGTKITKLK